jgi:hypothetical protein
MVRQTARTLGTCIFSSRPTTGVNTNVSTSAKAKGIKMLRAR